MRACHSEAAKNPCIPESRQDPRRWPGYRSMDHEAARCDCELELMKAAVSTATA